MISKRFPIFHIPFLYILTVLLASTLILTPSFGNGVADSLYQVIKNAPNDTIKALNYGALLRELSMQGDDKLEEITQECLEWSKKNNSSYGLGTANYYLGKLSEQEHQYETAINHANLAKDYYAKAKDNAKVVDALMFKSFCYGRLNNPDQRVKAVEEALSYAKKGDTNPARIFNQLGWIQNNNGNLDKALVLMDSSIWYLRRDSLKSNLAISLLDKAVLITARDPQTAIESLKQGLDVLEDGMRPDVRAAIMSELASNYQKIGKTKEALEILYQQLDEAKVANDKMRLVDSYHVLGDAHNSFANSKKSLDFYSQCAMIADSINNSIRHCICIASKGLVYLGDRNIDSAIWYFEEAVSISENPGITAHVSCDLATAYIRANRTNEAHQTLMRVDSLVSLGQPDLPFLRNNAWAEYYLKLEQAAKAIPLCLKTLDFARGSSNINLEIKTSKLLWDAYQKQGNYQQAFDFLERHQLLEDSINQDNHIKQLTALDLTNQFEEEKELIAFENEKEQAILKEKEKRAYTLGIGALLLLIVLSVFYGLLRKRNKEIKSQKKTLEQLNSVKDTLFQIIGHDLKKPSLAFRGIAKNIDYLIGKGDLNRLQALGKEIDRDAHQFYSLTDNLLNWASIQKDLLPLKPEPVYLYEIAEENLQLFTSSIERKKLNVDIEIPRDIVLKVDKNSLVAILRNLMDNAIKYTPEGGKITLSTVENEDGINIEIKDSGVGIEPEKLQLIMSEDYLQSSDGTDNEKGAGIGLNIVKNLTDKIEGKLSILSELGLGSSFIINLPKKMLIST